MNTYSITDEKKHDLDELVAFSKKWTRMREKAMEIVALINDEESVSDNLHEIDYERYPHRWLDSYAGVLSIRKRVKLMICSFAKSHYGKDSICVDSYRGQDYVDVIFRFFDLVRVCYSVER